MLFCPAHLKAVLWTDLGHALVCLCPKMLACNPVQFFKLILRLQPKPKRKAVCVYVCVHVRVHVRACTHAYLGSLSPGSAQLHPSLTKLSILV